MSNLLSTQISTQVSELTDSNACFDDESEEPVGNEEAELDDGRFGLNDPSNPTIKAAFLKSAAIEPSGVNDPENGGEIFISTSARMTFRKAFPDWSKIRNSVLNKAIATAFARGQPHQYFKPRKGSGSDVGEVRLFGSTKFIGIVFGSDVRILAVKGSLPSIGSPPEQKPGSGPKPGSGDWQVQNIGEALKTK